MKIAILTESYAPIISGVSVFSGRLADYLVRKGHQVLIITPSQNSRTIREVNGRLIISRQRSFRNIFKPQLRTVLGSSKLIENELDRFQPDVIHFQDPGGCAKVGVNYAKKHHIALIGTYHFTYEIVRAYLPLKIILSPLLRPIIQHWCNELYNACGVVTCPTETVRKILLNYGITPPITPVSNGTILDRSKITLERRQQILKKLSIDPSRPICLYVGRIDVEKNVRLIVDAINLVPKKLKAQFVFVGGGGRLDDYRRLTKQNQTADRCIFTDFLDPNGEEIECLYQSAFTFLMPCLIETQSIATLEAMAASRPAIAVNSGALPELVRDHQTGLLVSLPTPDAYARSIIELLKNPKLADEMGHNARLLAEHHSMEKTIDQFESIYQGVIDQSALKR